MRILVTGSEGTIGRPLCAHLKEQGHEVYGVDIAHYLNECYMRADISLVDQIGRAIYTFKPDVVFNLAAEFGRHNGEHFTAQLWSSNVIGMKNILKLQGEYGFKLVHASSSEVYGEGPWDSDILDEGITDRCALRHHNDYAMSKWVNEQQIRNSSTASNTIVARFFNSYGPGEYYHPYRSVVCLFVYRALHNLPYTVYNGYNRVFMHLRDFIPSLAKCAAVEGGITINIGGYEYRSVVELHEMVQKAVGNSNSIIRFEEFDSHNTVNKRPDITRARKLLGHNPTIKLEEGISDTVKWMRKIYEV